MAFQQGTISSLPQGAQDVSVAFLTPFVAAPALVIPVVRNSSDDALKLMIQALVVTKSYEGFSVHLSAAPNTGNYSLDYVAGDPDTMFQLVTAAGVKITQLPVLDSLPADADLIPVTTMSPLPVTRSLPWGLLAAHFLRVASGAPGSPAAAGIANQIFVDDNYDYTHNGLGWGRSKRQTANWNFPDASASTQRGSTALVQDWTSVTVTFAAGSEMTYEPMVLAALENNSDDPIAMITGLVTAKTKNGAGLYNGFVYTFTSPIPTEHYKLVWEAVESSS